MTEKKIDLWTEIGNKCLRYANELLDGEPSVESVKMAKDLVEIAVSIDTLNLRWAEQNQYAGVVSRGWPLGSPAAKN